MAKNEVKYGAFLSYILIFANSLYGLVVAPYVLGVLGNSEYGVYKTVGGIIAVVSVLEMGIGATMQRYIAKMNASKQREQAENFSAMGLIQAGALAVMMLILGGGLYTTLEASFQAFTAQELARAKEIFVLMIFQVALHMFENFFFGVIAGYNRFTFSNTMKLCTLALRIILYFVILPLYPNAVAIVSITLAMEVLTIAVEILYLRFSVGHRIRFRKWDTALFKESFVYTLLLFVQSLIIQFNGHVDSWVIGSVIGTTAVSVYSFALQIFNMYEQCATSVSGVLLPTVTKKLIDGADHKEMENLVVKYGRMQWLFLGAALVGVICCGREFFELWLGKKLGPTAQDCWTLALILMIPVTFPLITNTCLTILKAKNMLRFRTVSMAYAVILNILLTYFGTKQWGYMAAAAGTATSTVVGSILSMNIYYRKKLGMRMMRVYKGIFSRITLCLLAACVPCFLLNDFLPVSWGGFLLKVAVFLLVYGVTLLLYGLAPQEKKILLRLKG